MIFVTCATALANPTLLRPSPSQPCFTTSGRRPVSRGCAMTSLFLLGLRYYVGNPPALLPRRLRIGGRTRKKFVERCSFWTGGAKING